jgi:hypothetical protein
VKGELVPGLARRMELGKGDGLQKSHFFDHFQRSMGRLERKAHENRQEIRRPSSICQVGSFYFGGVENELSTKKMSIQGLDSFLPECKNV